ncbi:MAG: aldo/keto reductase [Opitutales bacterium]|nr:aldo/keto reductase [Opitutales bacterium]
MNRRDFIKASTSTAVGSTLIASASAAPSNKDSKLAKKTQFRENKAPERRNDHPDMKYRQLGATGMMVSELVLGGIPLRRDNHELIDLALDRGINYIDSASGYGRDSESEKAIGQYFKNNEGSRGRIFLTTKISGFSGFRYRKYRDFFTGLPEDKKQRVNKRADEITRERGISQPGVFFKYFPGHENELVRDYRILAIKELYGADKVEGVGGFRKMMFDSLEGSLMRTGVDEFDVLFCPHGAASLEAIQEPEMLEVLREMKKQGKIRFAAVSTHTCYDHITRAAIDEKTYDLVMATYNIINHNGMDAILSEAHSKGLGFVAMKAAAAVRTHFDDLKPLPAWREEKLQAMVPGEQSAVIKAYQFVLSNPHVSAVITNSWNTDMLTENLQCIGNTVEKGRV